MKICTKCKEEKTLDMYNNSTKAKDGKQSQCRVCVNICNSKWKKDNREKHNINNRNCYNPETQILWKVNNRHIVLAGKARRRAALLCATPPWITAEHLHQIEDMYWLAKDLEAICGEAYHVDHIIPLQGKNVCGLHLPWNLQVLPSDINLAKNNSHTF